jgi:hypothetical protein
MPLIPPIDVNVSARRQSCILDVPLVLSRSGLLFAVRAARELNVWLARTLWQILDNTEFYRSHPRLLLGAQDHPGDDDATDTLPLIISEWEQARLENDLLGFNIFWAGDARHESLLPKDVDKRLIDRFDRAVLELDEDWAGDEGDYDPLRECHRDAVALAMALMPDAPLILTLRSENAADGVPAICRYLEECGIPAKQVNGVRSAREVRANLAGIFARTGLAELTWAGLEVVALHLVAPRALMLSAAAADDDRTYEDENDITNATRRAHDGASAWWWTVE